MSVIKVTFDNNRNGTEYSYFCDYDVEVGDRVIVDSPYHGYTTVTVVSVHAGTDAVKASKEVVNIVDDSRYRARKAAKERLAEIEAELSRKAEVNERARVLRKRFRKIKGSKALLAEADSLTHILNDRPDKFAEDALRAAGLEFVKIDMSELESRMASAFGAELLKGADDKE